jgi:hypothetical protein
MLSNGRQASSTKNAKLRIHLISGNGMRRNQREAGPKDPRQLLKYAIFYLVVAAILVVTNQNSKSPSAGGVQSESAANLEIDFSVTRKLEPNHLAGAAATMGAHVVHFRFTNQGNRPIFYPISPNTNRPMGRVVYRIDPGSNWRPLSQPELSASGAAELKTNGAIDWIEMPPGGSAEGDYIDPGFPIGEHAYELDLKFEANGKVSPLFSKPYPASIN